MTYKMIQVGTGGHGRSWCARFLPPNVADGLIEVVAAVDVNPEALENARQHLSLSPAQCYTDLERAFRENPADFCTIVVPPGFARDDAAKLISLNDKKYPERMIFRRGQPGELAFRLLQPEGRPPMAAEAWRHGLSRDHVLLGGDAPPA